MNTSDPYQVTRTFHNLNTSENAFFKLSDLCETTIYGHSIDAGWWSRFYEYPWALQYAAPGQVVADMGCGYEQRPFKDMLSEVCKKVYAVDAHELLLSLERRSNVEFVVADFTQRIEAIPDNSLDVVYCISTLEHVPEMRQVLALQEFMRCMKPGGICVLTVDVQYDMNGSLDYWGAVNLPGLIEDAQRAGFRMRESADYGKEDAVFHVPFNLCVFHCVLVKDE